MSGGGDDDDDDGDGDDDDDDDAGPLASAKWSRGFVGCRFQNQAFENLPLIDGKKFLKVFPALTGKHANSSGKNQISDSFTEKVCCKCFRLPRDNLQIPRVRIKFPFRSPNFIRYHGRTVRIAALE